MQQKKQQKKQPARQVNLLNLLVLKILKRALRAKSLLPRLLPLPRQKRLEKGVESSFYLLQPDCGTPLMLLAEELMSPRQRSIMILIFEP